MNTTTIKLIGLSIVLILVSCGGGGDDGPTDPVGLPPTPAKLSSPVKDEVCLDGISVNNTQSEVKFEWEASQHVDSYSLVLTNLKSNQTTNYSTTKETQNVTLIKGYPYSWYVVSKSNKLNEPAQSETWKFYLAGEGIVSYAPFPADAVFPEMGSSITATNSTLSLSWKGSHVDNDIVGYEVFYDTVNPPLASMGITTEQLINVGATSGNSYYWQVITRDGKGNSSTSGIFQFKIK